jgi:hypothetical protein
VSLSGGDAGSLSICKPAMVWSIELDLKLNLKLMWLTLSSLSLNSLTCGSTSNTHAHAGTTQDDATTCVDVCSRCARNSHWSALYPDQR